MQTVETLPAGKTIESADRRTAWLVVAASSVGLFMHFGSLLVNAFGVMLTTLCDELGWSRGDVSFAFSLATVAAILTMTLTGFLTDRFGARRPILICLTVFGALYASLSLLTPHLWHLYVVFLLLGMVGPGTSAVPNASLISRWFLKRRGLALGVAMSGTALGGVVWPKAIQALLDQFGLRNTYAISGGAVLLVAVPLLLLLLKEAPKVENSSEKSVSAEPTDGLTRGEALRSGVLWLMLFAFFIVSMSIQACIMHLVPMLKDRGMTPGNATDAASLMGLAGMIGRFGMSYLLDLLPAVRVPTIAFSLVAAGIFLLFTGATGTSAYFAAALIGIGYGSESATIPYLVGQYFGLRSFGEIYSYLFITVPFGAALGPYLMGVGFDRTGSYRLVLLFCGVATVIAALTMLRLSSYPTFSKIRSR
ncbi:MAG TPA: MFS transporter [Blastocatellia bacterium]|nr:MFS transporter [Blastocatellia bacterium]